MKSSINITITPVIIPIMFFCEFCGVLILDIFWCFYNNYRITIKIISSRVMETKMDGGCGCTGGNEVFTSDPFWRGVATAVIVIVILLAIWKMVVDKDEKYVGKSLADMNGIYTSGATLRRLGQEFSSTNQGVQTTIYNADVGGQDVAMHVIVSPASTVTLTQPI
jgi:hypothetical protein